jgi:hypothetical protein
MATSRSRPDLSASAIWQHADMIMQGMELTSMPGALSIASIQLLLPLFRAA